MKIIEAWVTWLNKSRNKSKRCQTKTVSTTQVAVRFKLPLTAHIRHTSVKKQLNGSREMNANQTGLTRGPEGLGHYVKVFNRHTTQIHTPFKWKQNWRGNRWIKSNDRSKTFKNNGKLVAFLHSPSFPLILQETFLVTETAI